MTPSEQISGSAVDGDTPGRSRNTRHAPAGGVEGKGPIDAMKPAGNQSDCPVITDQLVQFQPTGTISADIESEDENEWLLWYYGFKPDALGNYRQDLWTGD